MTALEKIWIEKIKEVDYKAIGTFCFDFARKTYVVGWDGIKYCKPIELINL
jgi:hypothetical protein